MKLAFSIGFFPGQKKCDKIARAMKFSCGGIPVSSTKLSKILQVYASECIESQTIIQKRIFLYILPYACIQLFYSSHLSHFAVY